MILKVAKFGGSSLADAEHFMLVKNIVRADSGRKYIVPSAPGKRNLDDSKITDLLLKCDENSKNGKSFDSCYLEIKHRFDAIIEQLNLKLDLSKEYEAMYNGMLLHQSDYVLSRGEYLSGRILAELLGFDFVTPETCIFFDADGNFLPEETNLQMKIQLKKHEYAVIPGFYGALPNGEIKTFSRGGSDITGAIVARATIASVYENWTDVSGVMMANPKYVNKPKVLDKITYRELRDLSYMGATVLHEDAVFPVKKEGIPIHVCNTNAPFESGSWIVGHRDLSKKEKDSIIGIAGKNGYFSIQIEKENMRTFPHLHCDICSIMEDYNLSIAHILYGVDSMNILLADNASLADQELSLVEDICQAVEPDTIYIDKNISLIAIVGYLVAHHREETLSRISKCLNENNIDLKMCDTGGSEISIFIGISSVFFEDAQRILYKEFER